MQDFNDPGSLGLEIDEPMTESAQQPISQFGNFLESVEDPESNNEICFLTQANMNKMDTFDQDYNYNMFEQPNS
jgi:hypothetical protein